MKKILFVAAMFFVMGGPRAQSIAEARKLLYYERYDGAAHCLQSLIRTDPNNAEAWWLLTRAYLHNGRERALRDSLSLMPAVVAQQPFALCAYGRVLLAEHKKDSATGCFTRALSITREKDPLILLAIARAHQVADSGDAGYSVELLNKAIKRDRRNPELYVALGNAYRKLQDGTDSYKAYQDALAQDSKYVDALYKLGKIFVTQNNAEMYLKYFNEAVAEDPSYAPAWYELYYHYYFRDVNKAMDCLNHYIACADPGIRNDYLVTDLLYSSRKYDSAIGHAQRLIDRQGKTSEPRLYKLIAYSYKELHDSSKALDYMKKYFNGQSDTGFVVKDYETMGEIYDAMNQPDSSVRYYVKAGNLEKDSIRRIAYCKKLAELYKKQKDYGNQALWLGRYYQASAKATNLDLFNWGLAWYMAKEYQQADSIFGIYEAKYPEQDFGYYWRARSDAAIDTSMSTGMAIPHYLKLIEIAGKDTANRTTRKHLIESYGYIAAYDANIKKDYPAAIEYFEKLLSLDPENKDAMRYVEILKKNLGKGEKKTGNEISKTEK